MATCLAPPLQPALVSPLLSAQQARINSSASSCIGNEFSCSNSSHSLSIPELGSSLLPVPPRRFISTASPCIRNAFCWFNSSHPSWISGLGSSLLPVQQGRYISTACPCVKNGFHCFNLRRSSSGSHPRCSMLRVQQGRMISKASLCISNGYTCFNSSHLSSISDLRCSLLPALQGRIISPASPCIRNEFFCSNSNHPSSISDRIGAHTPSIPSFTTKGNPACNSLPCSPPLDSATSGKNAWLWLPRTALACTLTCIFCVGGIPGLQDSEFRAIVGNFLGVGVAHAALMHMPPEKLNNSYYLVRSGESEFEKMGIINTNPVMKTNIDNGLSDNGKKQAVKAALKLQEMGACDVSCWIWPSITQRAYQAAEIIAFINNVNRSRIVPEYSFLDARGLGAYEGRSLSLISEVYEADSESPKFRPPPFQDGTPNESVADVVVRITQLMSILETQYLGENIIIVAPDSDNLSVLQASLTGLDLRRHSMLSFLPGEVRRVDLDTGSVPRTRLSGLITCPNPLCN